MVLITTNINKLSTEGNLVYEYNPLHNYRLDEDTYLLNNGKLISLQELLNIYNWESRDSDPDIDSEIVFYYNYKKNIFKEYKNNEWKTVSTLPDQIKKYSKGTVTDLITEELGITHSHSVLMIPSYSYDNTVDLIITDGNSFPRVINTRFSATEKDLYKIIDRKGNTDTNLYTRGNLFKISTYLYNTTLDIPTLKFIGIEYGGRLSIGNYHFYFKYKDDDGNETDFVAESGLVSVFIGNIPSSIKSGTKNENSNKIVKFILSNINTNFKYVSVYFTKTTSEIYQESVTQAFKIITDYEIKNDLATINITGFEQTLEISINEINLLYLIYEKVQTSAICQNRLFIGNVSKEIDYYEDLQDISLRFIPSAVVRNYDYGVDHNYSINANYDNSYYNPNFIYNNTGYWDTELYRLGIVYIFYDGTLSPVFNIRGVKNLKRNNKDYTPTNYSVFNSKGDRNFIQINYDYSFSESNVENSKGVINFNCETSLKEYIGINISTNQEVLEYLNKYQIKGYFFVRLKRIPTTLCQAFMIGIDYKSHTPVIPIGEDKEYIAESIISSKTKVLSHEFNEHIYKLNKCEYTCGICPEYDVNAEYYNNLFTGGKFQVQKLSNNNWIKQDSILKRHFYSIYEDSNNIQELTPVNIIGIEDNVKLASINKRYFSARAGEAESPSEFEFIEETVSDIENATNILRGSFGPYLGIASLPKDYQCNYINIKIPDYDESNLDSYFNIRYNDKSPFMAISDRIPLILDKETNTYTDNSIVYRGDCYLCQFTHRINRNFNSSSAPTNNIIVEKNSWYANWTKATKGLNDKDKVEYAINKEQLNKINLGDINAVQLGMWLTIQIKSTYNLNIRSVDDSHSDEKAIFGHSRGFYPYLPINAEGSFKLPEALCINKGFGNSLSSRYNFEIPNVPYIKRDFTNRICYSDVLVNSTFKNSFRIFRGQSYRDYPKTYGSITKLIELGGNLLCVFEHGIALIPVNERTVAGNGDGGSVFINTSNVLPENPKVISDVYGSQWIDSIIKTASGVYGVDTNAKKIWYTNGSEIKLISDWKIESFLNRNLTLKERETTPIIGVRNVKTHYNRNKGDVMFTFYDNLEGITETVWNVCWNEYMQAWTTFYSWLPSYSENIQNTFFSFDRTTSKKIAKLALSLEGLGFLIVTVDENLISNETREDLTDENGDPFKIEDSEHTLETEGVIIQLNTSDKDVTYELLADPWKNNKHFEQDGDQLKLVRPFTEDELKKTDRVIYLNIRTYKGDAKIPKDYQIAIILQKDLYKLTTSFWKHGFAKNITGVDNPKPTQWYGKLHPFEIEFVVNDNPDSHKIFDNLQIISNSAEPDSFHYEIIGDCYNFAKDKKNMYIRQEATKELYLANGSDIMFDKEYKEMESEHRKIQGSQYFDKSTILPLYYSRQDSINTIEDHYHEKEGIATKDYSALSGGEVKYYPTMDEFRIVSHSKAVDMTKDGRIRGNMHYKEDRWDIQINPLTLVLKNEKDWSQCNLKNNEYTEYPEKYVPIEINQCPIPADIKTEIGENGLYVPPEIKRGIVSWNWQENQMGEAKLKDKFIKIRIRYSGEKLAIISAIRTLYSISYS